ncbi:serine/threonine-protein kinase PBL28 [Populus alba x Populus x berolinensis]|uniref:Serine/threonine-protein kinase PBL28 n=1 Tax=Populus alba x Populus x berolinensis TaxID=444605 RepID=A0AAD6W350_9ROSI|nr:serine/threonine-protein kinase PBL28 [Populus alba x Populus x berolinensis]
MAAKSYYYLATQPTSFPNSPAPLIHETRITNNNRRHDEHIWGALIIGIVTVSVVTSLCLFFRRRLFPIFGQRYWLHKGSLKAGTLSLRRFQLEELERATKNFSDDSLLGNGAFANVYKGTFELEGTALAIKRDHSGSFQSTEEFRNEVNLLSKVRHRNLVGLVGFCEKTGAKRTQMLVYEYVPNGSLLDCITGKGGRSLTWRQRVNIAIGAAKGIAHLHDGIKPSIIHRDIKPSNILVGDGFEAKVSDFGLVKMGPIGDQSHVSSQIKGTPGYLDPAYFSSCHLSPFSDVYSFGVILLQLVTARPAVDLTRNPSNYNIIEWARPSLDSGRVEEILDSNLLTDSCDMEMMLKMGELGLRCLVKNPKDRPTMTRVWQELEEALYLADNFVDKEPSNDYWRSSSSSRRSMDRGPRRSYENSQSFVSIDGVGFQRFHVEMDSIFFHSTSMKCLEAASVSIDIDKNNLRGISEETSKEETS